MSIKIITVSRQFGSGGRSIAKKVADELGFNYYDKEIIDHVSVETGFCKDYIAERGEHAPGRTIFSYGLDPMGVPNVMNGMSAADYLWSIQRQVILKIAEEDTPCVIVGRCADYILGEHEGVLNVFVHADMEFRKDRIVRLYGESEKNPEKRLNDKDKKRKTNYMYYTNQEWGNATNYDICLDTSRLGVDKCAEIICNIVKNS
ncbi:MAG: cytidylate kinase-like family protein [Clostridia bacterium]|nr:cytidylate kinase-like family protein [Clostridia bacterium]